MFSNNSGGLFGQSNTSGGLFGQKPAATSGTGSIGGLGTGFLFGQNQNQNQNQNQSSGGLFGNTSNNQSGGLFGNKPNLNPSGGLLGNNNQNQSGGLFGSNTQNNNQNQSGGLFGSNTQNQNQNQSGGLFGSNTQNQNQNQSGGLFGNNQNQNNQSGGLFGNNQNQNQSSGGLFGNNQNQNQASGGLFGNTSANKTGGLFGGNTSTTQSGLNSGGLFGNNQNNQTSSGLFGNNQNNNQTSSGLFGNNQNNNQTSTGLFGNNQNNQTSSGLFGNNQNNQPNSNQTNTGLFGNQNKPNTGLFGASNNTGSGGLFGGQGNLSNSSQPSFAWSSAKAAPVSQPQPLAPTNVNQMVYTPAINDQINKIKAQIDPLSPTCILKTHFYNKFSEAEINQLLQQQRPANETPDDWDAAMDRRPLHLHYPVKVTLFTEVAQRIETQLDYVGRSRILLNAVNGKVDELLQKHDLDNTTRIMRAKTRHTQLSRRLLRLATVLAILKLKGYPLLPEEEEILRQFGLLNAKLNDPNNPLGKLNDAFARLAILKERAEDLNTQFDTQISGLLEEEKEQEGGDNRNEVVKKLSKVMLKQQIGLNYLNEVLERDVERVSVLERKEKE